MSLPPDFLPTTCDVYRPFGDATPLATAVPGRLTAGFRGASDRGGIVSTHTLDFESGIDIRDGCSRTAGNPAIDYADGDEVRIPSGGTTRYVVVWVEVQNRGTAGEFQRAYLLRHEASWPTP